MPRSPIILEKQPWEERLLDFDFVGQFADEGVTVSSGSFLTAVNLSGGAVSIVIGSASWSGTKVQALFSGGATGERYLITARAIGSNGEKAELEGVLSILERAS